MTVPARVRSVETLVPVGRRSEAGQAHVEDLDHVAAVYCPLLVRGDQQVGRLDVPVNHRPVVGVLEAEGGLPDVGAGHGDRQRAAVLDQLGQVHPCDVLHRQEVPVADLVGVEHTDDVRVTAAWPRPAPRGGSRLRAVSFLRRELRTTLRATTRFRLSCTALKTRPIPPSPSLSRITYWPTTSSSALPETSFLAW